MAHTGIEWSFVRGEDTQALILTGPAGVDPTGWTLALYVGTAIGAPPLTLTGTPPTITVGGSGPWTLTVAGFTRAQSSAFTFDKGVWSVWRTDAGFNRRLASGILDVKAPVRLPA